MSITHFGIYLAYPPTVDLRHEGLGRYLAALLKGAQHREDICFVLVCPSWSRKALEELFISEQVSQKHFKIISPLSEPLVLKLYNLITKLRKNKSTDRTGKWKKFATLFEQYILNSSMYSVKLLVQARSYFDLFKVLFNPYLYIGLLSFLFLPLLIVKKIVQKNYHENLKKKFSPIYIKLYVALNKIGSMLNQPKNSRYVVHAFKHLEQVEFQLMQDLIKQQTNVKAWYSPTAFWPAFNNIVGPKLMCVPDVVLTDFPIDFCKLGDDRILDNFTSIETAIYSGENYVTYSESTKWNVLVDRYNLDPHTITVIPHAPNELGYLVNIEDKHGGESASLRFCENLLQTYSDKNFNCKMNFLFYATQFRPNKNIINLLRAYEYLLRKRYINYKLVLTGNPKSYEPVKKFIKEHNLEKEIICVQKISVNELAAFYKLAKLAVNPSLSEGGCPFTFTEALSVNTPVVMAKIPVTEEILCEPKLQEMTFFDPYDWRSIAYRIEWALNNRDELLKYQKEFYQLLAQRNWTDVANEHIAVLEKIALSKCDFTSAEFNVNKIHTTISARKNALEIS